MSLWDDMGLSGKRVLILHHDDLGITLAQNLAYRQLGFPTGSVMVPSGWAMALGSDPMTDLGVHVTLTSEWPAPRLRPLTGGASLVDASGFFWSNLAELWQHADAEEAGREIEAQIDALTRWGVAVTHLDSHMGAVLRPDIAERLVEIARRQALPVIAPENVDDLLMPAAFREPLRAILRHAGMPTLTIVNTYDAPGADRKTWYVDTLSHLEPGVYHLLHHAQLPTEEGRQLGDWEKRNADFEALSDPAVRRVVEEFLPLTYGDVRTAYRQYHP